jgi:hypothetical protein
VDRHRKQCGTEFPSVLVWIFSWTGDLFIHFDTGD